LVASGLVASGLVPSGLVPSDFVASGFYSVTPKSRRTLYSSGLKLIQS
jgi:hypothetical protein